MPPHPPIFQCFSSAFSCTHANILRVRCPPCGPSAYLPSTRGARSFRLAACVCDPSFSPRPTFLRLTAVLTRTRGRPLSPRRSAQVAQKDSQIHGLRAELASARRVAAATEKATLAAARAAAMREAELTAELAATKIAFEARAAAGSAPAWLQAALAPWFAGDAVLLCSCAGLGRSLSPVGRTGRPAAQSRGRRLCVESVMPMVKYVAQTC